MIDEKHINLNTFYSPQDVIDMGIFPWKSRTTFIKILSQKRWQAVFNPIIEQKTERKRHYIKGSDLVKFMKMHKEGKLN